MPLSTVTSGGWTLAYSSTYATPLETAPVLASAPGAYMMLAARQTGSSTILLLGAAPRGDVTFDVGHGNTTHVANGVGWYYSSDHSWGFAEGNDLVLRGEADILDAPNADRRLSWHTGIPVGGYRVGAITGLNNSPAYERLVFQAGGLTASAVTTLTVQPGAGITVDLNGPRANGAGAADACR